MEYKKVSLSVDDVLKDTLDVSLKGTKPLSDHTCLENRVPIDEVLYEQDGFTEFIAKQFKRQLADKVTDILSTENQYIVSVSPARVYRDITGCVFKIRVQLNHKPLVRCKDCKWRPQNADSPLCWCDRFGKYTDGEWYCADGEERKLADYMMKKGDELGGTV